VSYLHVGLSISLLFCPQKYQLLLTMTIFSPIGTKHSSHQDYMEKADKARRDRLSSGSAAPWFLCVISLTVEKGFGDSLFICLLRRWLSFRLRSGSVFHFVGCDVQMFMGWKLEIFLSWHIQIEVLLGFLLAYLQNDISKLGGNKLHLQIWQLLPNSNLFCQFWGTTRDAVGWSNSSMFFFILLARGDEYKIQSSRILLLRGLVLWSSSLNR